MKYRQYFFIAGIIFGALMAMFALLWPSASTTLPLDDRHVAIVNGQPIPQSDFDLALESMARETRNSLPDDAPAYALDRLIEEELLFQRAIALGMTRKSSVVRRNLVLSVIDLAIAQAVPIPDDEELREFFNDNLDYFAPEPRLRISWTISQTRDGSREKPGSHPPNRLLTLSSMRRYVGERLLTTLKDAKVDDIIGPIEITDRFHWVDVIERIDGPAPSFENVRMKINALWQKRAREDALEKYIADLRDAADITRKDVTQP